jgi:hypothetical protein
VAKIEGKIGCAFFSSGGGELTCMTLLIVLMNYGLLTFGVPDYVAPAKPFTTAPSAPANRTTTPSAKPAAVWAGD